MGVESGEEIASDGGVGETYATSGGWVERGAREGLADGTSMSNKSISMVIGFERGREEKKGTGAGLDGCRHGRRKD